MKKKIIKLIVGFPLTMGLFFIIFFSLMANGLEDNDVAFTIMMFLFPVVFGGYAFFFIIRLSILANKNKDEKFINKLDADLQDDDPVVSKRMCIYCGKELDLFAKRCKYCNEKQK